MKTVKSMLIATALIGTSLVSGLPAQEVAAPAYKPAVGDTVRMNPDCERYLTGEKPSTWVYNTTHTIGQIGTQRFPDGVLLMPIQSWTSLEHVTPVKAQASAQSAYKPAVGDTVRIKPECEKYLTGEKPSAWVYDTVHTIGQIGTQRFPDGVLLMSIRSWICWDCITLVKAQNESVQVQVPLAVEPARTEEESSPVAEKPAQAEGESSPVAEKPVQAEEESAPVAVIPVPVEEKPAVVEGKPARVVGENAPETVVEPIQEVTPSVDQQPVEDMTHHSAVGDTLRAKPKFYGKYDRFTIGLRGGVASMMHHVVKGNWTYGGDAVLDLQYAHYWKKDGRSTDLGLITGLSVGYAQSGLRTDYDSTAFIKDNVNYTVVARKIRETDHSLQVEVPLMFSIVDRSGFFMNLGPKFMMPVYSPFQQTVDEANTHITAYFPETGITVIDNPVTGRYTGQQPATDNGVKFTVNVMMTLELGCEWILNSGNSFGLGAYADYSVFNTYTNTTSTEGLFKLTPPTDDDKAHLDVLSATKTYADKLGYFDVGLKMAYHFNFPKKRRIKVAKQL